jgi:hypothetical protein
MQDNFAHEMIRYDYRSLEALITVNPSGDYGIYYTRITDRLSPPPQPPMPPRASTTSIRSKFTLRALDIQWHKHKTHIEGETVQYIYMKYT